LVEILVFERGLVTLSTNFRGKGSRPPRLLAPENEFLGYDVILRLAVLIQYGRVTDRQTDRHTMMAIARASLAPRG